MIAVIKVGGHQAIVEQGEVIRIDKIDAKEGSKVQFETLLLSEPDGSGFQLGAPLLDTKVEAKVIEHARDAKVRVFKMKRRKRYRRTLGHRQDYTVIEITSLGGAAAPKKAAAKPAAAKAEKPAAKKASTKDDLTKIEGIGPKIAETLANAGVATFADLSKQKSAKISEIIADVRGSHVTDTWPKQAKMAADGKWDELKKWQDEMDGGKA